MMRLVAVRAVCLCAVIAGATAVCAAQAYTPPPPPLTTLPPCPVEKDAKKRAKRKDCDPTVYPPQTVDAKARKGSDAPPATTPAEGTASQKFPFPGEQPTPEAPAAKKFPYPGQSAGDATQTPAPAKKATETPAGKTFPYPGEPPSAAPPDTGSPAPASNEVPSSSSSAGSSSSSSSSEDDARGGAGTSQRQSATKNPDDDDEDQPKLTDKGSQGKRSKKVIKPQSDEDRVDEDLSVAKFYGQSGNYMGAYLRARDAVATKSDSPEAHFAVGEAAKHLKKKDEAVAEFQAYLKLAPDGEKAKAAEKALDELKQ